MTRDSDRSPEGGDAARGSVHESAGRRHRQYDADGFRIIQRADRHPGMIAYRLDENRERVIVGPEDQEEAKDMLRGERDG